MVTNKSFIPRLIGLIGAIITLPITIPIGIMLFIGTFFKKTKTKSALDELMDIPEFKARKEIYDVMSEMNKKEGCIFDEMPEGIGEFGLEPTNPIPTNTGEGSILYLEGLRAPDGTKINYERLEALKVGNIQKLIDKYSITHETGDELAIIYLSPYQAKNSQKAPKGFEQVSPLL